MWIDSHCHLDFHWKGPERSVGDLVRAAMNSGVSTIITSGDTLASSEESWRLARAFPEVFCTIGIHPNTAGEWSPAVAERFRGMVKEDCASVQSISQIGATRIVGLGEMGLDYFRDRASLELQKKVFREQLQLAKELDLPVVIHCRDAFDDVLTILGDEKSLKVVFHCFTGGLEVARRIWAKGWVTSFSAIISYPRNEELRRAVKACPPDLYFLETDAPFLPPRQRRGERNEPAFVVETGRVIAELRGESLDAIARQTTENVTRFFLLQADSK